MSSIFGVQVVPLKILPDDRGCVMHGWRVDQDPASLQEVYATIVRQHAVKGWHKHTKLTVRYIPVVGEVKLVLVDGRVSKSTFGAVDEFVVGLRNYARVVVPPGVWIGMQGLTPGESMLINCADYLHVPNEMERRNPRLSLVLAPGVEYHQEWRCQDR